MAAEDGPVLVDVTVAGGVLEPGDGVVLWSEGVSLAEVAGFVTLAVSLSEPEFEAEEVDTMLVLTVGATDVGVVLLTVALPI